MRYLITGCAGFIGANLAFRLATLGEDVWGIDSLAGSYDIGLRKDSVQRFLKQNIAFSPLDLVTDHLGFLQENWDYVIHCASLPAYLPGLDENAYHNADSVATQRLIDVLENYGSPTRLIFLSSSSVVGSNVVDDETIPARPHSIFGKSKREAEQIVLEANSRGIVSSTSLRLFSVYGERERSDKLLPRLLASNRWNRPFKLFEGSAGHVRDFIHVDDVCSAIIKVIGNWEQAKGEIFHIGTGQETIVEDIIERACRVFEQRPRIVKAPARIDEQVYSVARIQKAERLLDWKPRISLDEGLVRIRDFAKALWY